MHRNDSYGTVYCGIMRRAATSASALRAATTPLGAVISGVLLFAMRDWRAFTLTHPDRQCGSSVGCATHVRGDMN